LYKFGGESTNPRLFGGKLSFAFQASFRLILPGRKAEPRLGVPAPDGKKKCGRHLHKVALHLTRIERIADTIRNTFKTAQ
jgi:hypothetical protein